MNPLKQGLKLLGNRAFGGTGAMSLSMNPLKQGLKRHDIYDILANRSVFIHESIKTRVETQDYRPAAHKPVWSLSMNPLKQGLKHIGDKPHYGRQTGSLSMNPLKQGLKLSIEV